MEAEEDESEKNIFQESEILDLEGGYGNAKEILPEESNNNSYQQSEEQVKGESTIPTTTKSKYKNSHFIHPIFKKEVDEEDDDITIEEEEEEEGEEDSCDYNEEEYRKKLSLSISNSEFLFEDSIPIEIEKRPPSITKEEISKVVETILGYEHDNDDEMQGREPSSSAFVEKIHPVSLHIPHVLETTPVRKIPFSADDALKCLEDQVKRMKELKTFDGIQSQQDLNKLHRELTKWKSKNPSTASTLSKQLALEIFTNAFVHHRFSKLTPSFSDNLRSNLIPMNEIYNKLTSNPNFNQYLSHSDPLSIKRTLKMCFVSASNAINRFETSHKSAVEIIEQLESILEELTHKKDTQCKSLSADYGQHLNTLSSKCNSLSSLELVAEKKDFYWLLSKPYHKNDFGCRVPKWELRNFMPFSFEDVRQSAWRDYELDNLKDAILETVIQTRTARIKNRYNQLLMKFYDAQEKHEDIDLSQLCRSKYNFNEPTSSSLFSCKSYPVIDLSNRNWNRNNLPVGMKVQLVLDPKTLEPWRNQSIAKLKKITLKEIANDSSIHINWTRVAGKMGKHDNFTNRTAEDCKRTWESLLRPVVLNDYEWKRSQITKLMDAVEKYGDRNWDLVAKELGSTFTSFQCFYTYERLKRPLVNHYEKTQHKLKELELGSFGFSQIVELSREFTPEMTRDKYARLASKFAEVITDIPNTPNLTQLAEYYNRFKRPDLVKGEFQVVEDLILLVCMVKMQEYLKEAKTFSPLRNYLPWRFLSTWTVRANSIFRPWRSAWTREEDLLLLSLVESHQKPDWSLFCTYFDVTKNRKNTRSRYLLLQEKLKVMSFDEFREEYEKISPRVKCQTKLSNLISQLKIVLDLPKTPVPSAEKLQNPTESDLWNYLTSFDNSYIQQTISDLESYHECVDSSSIQVSEDIPFQEPPVKKSKTTYLDRRRFVRGDPESTASAIHLRKLTLISPEDADPVTPFEGKVYKYFENFKGRSVKSTTEHKNIPDAKVLMAMSEVHRIIQQNHVNGYEGSVESDNMSLNEDGFPIITNELNLPAPTSKKKTKQDLKKDRKERMLKLNQELAKKRQNKSTSVVKDD